MTETAYSGSGHDGIEHDGIELDLRQRDLLSQVLDKWSLQVLSELCERPCRFNELRRAIPAVTQKSLTAVLRRLERNGIVHREMIRSRPVAVQYRITPLGKTLRGPVEILQRWTNDHIAQVEAARDRFDEAGLAGSCDDVEAAYRETVLTQGS